MSRKRLIQMTRSAKASRLAGSVALVVAFISLCILIATNILPPPDVVALAEDYKIILFEESEDKLVFLLQSSSGISAYYKDISDTGHALAGPYPIAACHGAFFRNNVVQVARSEKYLLLEQLSPENEYQLMGAQTNVYDASISKGDLFAFSSNYDLFLSKSGGPIKMFDCENNDPIALEGLENVEFLASTPGGWIYTYANEKLSRWQDSTSYKERKDYACTCPVKLVGEDAFVDADGTMYLINGEVLAPVFSDDSMDGLNTFKSYGTDLELFVADTLQQVHKYDWYGQELEIAQVDGDILAITSQFALVEKEGEIHLAPLEFHEADEEPTPTPEPTTEPTPDESDVSSELPTTPPAEETEQPTSTPSPSTEPTQEPEATATPEPTTTPSPELPDDNSPAPTPDMELMKKIEYAEKTGEDGHAYIMLRAGTRAEDLRRVKKPEAIKITDSTGGIVYAGSLKTGMKVGESTIVIRGDCTGTGTVASADIYFMEECMLDIDYFETEASFFAADMNGDGKITTMDLVLVSKEIARITGVRGRGE